MIFGVRGGTGSNAGAAAAEPQQRAWLIFLALWVGLFMLFLGPCLLLRESFIKADYGVQHWPWAQHWWQSLHGGESVAWTRKMACGFPLAAEGQIGVFYLFGQLFYRLLPFWAAYTWSIPFHLALGAAGIYVYARRASLSREAALLAAVIFSFGSAYGGCGINTATLRALAWLPWCLAIGDAARSGAAAAGLAPVLARAAATAGWAVAVSQMWTAGSMQMALYASGYLLVHEMLSTLR